MTTLRLTGERTEIRRILDNITPLLPEILTVEEYETRSGEAQSIYITLKEPLQNDADKNLQDWMIIEYCKVWRTTPEIKKYFKLEYEATREICDRLFSSGALSRRLQDKSYAYIDRGMVHRCADCISFQKITDKEILDELDNGWTSFDGYCLCKPNKGNIFGYEIVKSNYLNECKGYTDIQTRLGDEE